MYWYRNFTKVTMGLIQFLSIMHFIIYLALIHQLNDHSWVNKLNEPNEIDVNVYNVNESNENDVNILINLNYNVNLAVFITYTHMECNTNFRCAQCSK